MPHGATNYSFRQVLNAFSTTTYPATVAPSFVSAFIDVPKAARLPLRLLEAKVTITMHDADNSKQGDQSRHDDLQNGHAPNFPPATLPLPQFAPLMQLIGIGNYAPDRSNEPKPYNFRYFVSPPLLAQPNQVSGTDYAGDNPSGR